MNNESGLGRVFYSTPARADFIQNYLLAVLSTGQHSYWESPQIIQQAKAAWELIHGE